MSVQKIFGLLIVCIVCIMAGAFVLNFFVPNLLENLSTSIEGTIFNATGFKWDLNGDGVYGSYKDDMKGSRTLEESKSGADTGVVDGVE